MKRIIPVVIAICAVLGMKTYNKSKATREIKAEVVRQIDSSVPPGTDMDYLHRLIDFAHPLAMDKAYQMGGRKGADFDGQTYRTTLYQQMGLKARQDGQRDLATLFLAESGIQSN